MTNKLYDVIVIGAGPGGCASAISLAQAGFEVLLLDKAIFPRDKVCGDFISPRSIRVLRHMNCLEVLENTQPNRVDKASMYINGEHITDGVIPQMDDLTAYGYTSPRYTFDNLLFQQAKANNITTVEDCNVTDFQVTHDDVIISAKQGRTSVTYRGRLAIASDGVRSVLAKKLGFENRNSKARIIALRAYMDDVQGDPSEAGMCFDARYFPGYAWIFPLGNGKANVGLGMVQDSYKRYDINLRDELLRFIERDPYAYSRLHGCQMEGRIVGWPLNTYQSSAQNYGERILFVGDAGSFIDPINGEGIHTALESGRIAARVAEQALHANDFSAPYLAQYRTLWRQAFDLDLRSSDFIVTAIQNRAFLGLWLLALRMIGRRAHQDQDYAARCGGILAGVVPTHTAFTPEIAIKTLMQDPTFYVENIPLTFDEGVDGLVKSGLTLTSDAINMLNDLIEQPDQTFAWGRDVVSKGTTLFTAILDNMTRSKPSEPIN